MILIEHYLRVHLSFLILFSPPTNTQRPVGMTQSKLPQDDTLLRLSHNFTYWYYSRKSAHLPCSIVKHPLEHIQHMCLFPPLGYDTYTDAWFIECGKSTWKWNYNLQVVLKEINRHWWNDILRWISNNCLLSTRLDHLIIRWIDTLNAIGDV